jgi:excisionase family DNA binding protein
MPAGKELSAAKNALSIVDANQTWSPVRPEEAPYGMPIQQSLDLDKPRVDASEANKSRSPTRKTRVNKPLRVADKCQKMSWAGEGGTPISESPQCDCAREAEEHPAAPSRATSVRPISASPLPSSTSATGSGTVLPSRAPRRADVPLAERVALSVEEAAALLGISRDLAYDLVARGELPSVRLGRRLVVPRRALEGALDRFPGAG